jgi:phage shock protein A
MLDKAEDPEKMVRLIIREMEDTLVEIKASCAQSIATKKRIQRQLDEFEARAAEWGAKAQLAVNKGREDLAREALLEKRRYLERADGLQRESSQFDALVEQYQQDIVQLEEKLAAAREKQRVLAQRHAHAQERMKAQGHIRKIDSTQAMTRFDHLERRVDHMEAEADLINYGRKRPLHEEFAALEGDDELERELAQLKAAAGNTGNTPPPLA